MDWLLVILFGAIIVALGTYFYNRQSSTTNKERFDHLSKEHKVTQDQVKSEADRIVGDLKDAIAELEKSRPSLFDRYRSRFTRGFVILGSQDGVISFKPYPSDKDSVQINAIWSEAVMIIEDNSGLVTLQLPQIRYSDSSLTMNVGSLRVGPIPMSESEGKRVRLLQTPKGRLDVVAEFVEQTQNGAPVFVLGFDLQP